MSGGDVALATVESAELAERGDLSKLECDDSSVAVPLAAFIGLIR